MGMCSDSHIRTRADEVLLVLLKASSARAGIERITRAPCQRRYARKMNSMPSTRAEVNSKEGIAGQHETGGILGTRHGTRSDYVAECDRGRSCGEFQLTTPSQCFPKVS